MRHFKDVWELKQAILAGEFVVGNFTVYDASRVFTSTDAYISYLLELGFTSWSDVGERPKRG